MPGDTITFTVPTVTLTTEQIFIDKNTASAVAAASSEGGGIMFDDIRTPSTTTMSNSTGSGNSAGSGSGVFGQFGGGSVSISYSTIAGKTGGRRACSRAPAP